jgi:hypothetical protein
MGFREWGREKDTPLFNFQHLQWLDLEREATSVSESCRKGESAPLEKFNNYAGIT